MKLMRLQCNSKATPTQESLLKRRKNLASSSKLAVRSVDVCKQLAEKIGEHAEFVHQSLFGRRLENCWNGWNLSKYDEFCVALMHSNKIHFYGLLYLVAREETCFEETCFRRETCFSLENPKSKNLKYENFQVRDATAMLLCFVPQSMGLTEFPSRRLTGSTVFSPFANKNTFAALTNGLWSS